MPAGPRTAPHEYRTLTHIPGDNTRNSLITPTTHSSNVPRRFMILRLISAVHNCVSIRAVLSMNCENRGELRTIHALLPCICGGRVLVIRRTAHRLCTLSSAGSSSYVDANASLQCLLLPFTLLLSNRCCGRKQKNRLQNAG